MIHSLKSPIESAAQLPRVLQISTVFSLKMSSGFENAPITNLLSVLVVALSLTFRSGAVTLDLYRLLNGEVWRVVSSFLIFQNFAQLSVGMVLLYTCRQFERQMGSKKFGAFLVFTFFVSTLVSVGAAVTASSIGYYLIPSSGPFALIFALLAFYYWHIPKLHSAQYSILGMDLSEKSWIYLLALQLLFSDGVPSVVSALSGLLAGYLYQNDAFGFQGFRLPGVIESFFAAIGNVVLALGPQQAARPATTPGAPGAPRAPTGGTRQNLMMGGAQARGGGGGGGLWGNAEAFQNPHGDFAPAAAAAQAPRVVTPPSEESIEMLMGMGFEREAVVRALQSTGNDVEAAANSLLR